jgi:hypothetical protein
MSTSTYLDDCGDDKENKEMKKENVSVNKQDPVIHDTGRRRNGWLRTELMSVSTDVSSLVFEDMLSEHSHLLDEDSPPNNINQGPTRSAGIWIELPKCIEDRPRAMFPSPCFMGFNRSG